MFSIRTKNSKSIECVKGDIASQENIDAVVNAANRWLKPGGGVAGAIHRKAGPALYEECKALAPIECGQAVITDAYGLPNRRVIHCLGPVYGVDKPEEELLRSCYRNALLLADREGLESIAFCAISTGIFGYPIKPVAEAAIDEVLRVSENLETVRLIRFVLYSEKDYDIFVNVLKEKARET